MHSVFSTHIILGKKVAGFVALVFHKSRGIAGYRRPSFDKLAPIYLEQYMLGTVIVSPGPNHVTL